MTLAACGGDLGLTPAITLGAVAGHLHLPTGGGGWGWYGLQLEQCLQAGQKLGDQGRGL